MSRPRLRTIMIVPIVVTMTVAFAAFAIYIDRLETENRLADIDEELLRADRAFQPQAPPADAPASPQSGSGPPEESTVVPAPTDGGVPIQLLVDADGRILAGGGPGSVLSGAVIDELAAREGIVTVDQPRLRALVTPLADGTVQITALALSQLDEATADFRRTLVGGGLAILALAALVVWFLTGRVVRPVTRMASTANRIADGHLDTKIDDAGGSREISDLGTDLERMVSRLRTTIEERERSAAEATRARDNMRRFLADASHELRTPLTALKGYSDLYAGNMLQEPRALDRAMSRIGDESERLSMLVTDMLELAREVPTSDEAGMFDPCDTVRSVVADLRAAHPDLPIDLEIAPDLACEVVGSAHRFHQAVLNVGSNACHHTDPEDGVRFEVTVAASDAVITVIDHGPGIDPAEIDKIFLPFYRPETSRGRSGRGGAGLGLAITHQIVDRLGGTVAVSTTPGGGATFTLTMPCV